MSASMARSRDHLQPIGANSKPITIVKGNGYIANTIAFRRRSNNLGTKFAEQFLIAANVILVVMGVDDIVEPAAIVLFELRANGSSIAWVDYGYGAALAALEYPAIVISAQGNRGNV